VLAALAELAFPGVKQVRLHVMPQEDYSSLGQLADHVTMVFIAQVQLA